MDSQAQISLTVNHEDRRPCPFRVDIYEGNKCTRVWSGNGHAELSVAPGKVKLIVRRGIDHDAVALDLEPVAGGKLQRSVVLKRRFDLRALGWYGGENHMHGMHGRKDPDSSIENARDQALADGLDYLQVAFAWDPSFAWIPSEELDRRCRPLSDEQVQIGWNIEAPKAYMSEDDGGKKGNLHCYGHGWTVGLKDNALGKDFFRGGPAFPVIQEVQRQGGIVGCAHPVRAGFHRGNFVSNWASELPFDFVAGAPYAAVDILNDSPLLFFESQRLWYNLLNLGYKVSGSGNSDGALAANRGLGRFRTYTKIEGAFSWEKLAQGMSAGRCVASSGPFALFEVDGQGPGAEFAADGRVRRATVKAWSGALPGETLTAVQLVRNGEVVRAWDLHRENLRHWQGSFELQEDEGYAWYVVCVLSRSRDPQSVALWGPHLQELAAANAIFFLPDGFKRPQPQAARVQLTVTDASTSNALPALVEVIDCRTKVRQLELSAAGESIEVPATATLRISAPGFQPVERSIYMDSEIFEYCRNMNTVWPSFFSPETFVELRGMLQRIKFSVALKPQ